MESEIIQAENEKVIITLVVSLSQRITGLSVLFMQLTELIGLILLLY